jgi:hypothetical protein
MSDWNEPKRKDEVSEHHAKRAAVVRLADDLVPKPCRSQALEALREPSPALAKEGSVGACRKSTGNTDIFFPPCLMRVFCKPPPHPSRASVASRNCRLTWGSTDRQLRDISHTRKLKVFSERFTATALPWRGKVAIVSRRRQ